MGSHEVRFAIEAAIREAHERRHEYVTAEHLLYALLFEPSAQDVLVHCGGDIAELRGGLEAFFDKHVPRYGEEVEDPSPKQTVGFRRVLERAVLQVQSSERDDIEGSDLLVSIRAETEGHAVWLLDLQDISRLDMLEYISHGVGKVEPEEAGALAEGAEEEGSARRFTVDLTELARQGTLDPLIGRQPEIERMLQVLCRRTKNNPVLLGDPGVGKTAIVQGLAQRIVADEVPELLQGSEVLLLDLGSLLAGTKYRGQFEQRFKGALKDLVRREKPILFIDEFHMISGAGAAGGSKMDLSNLLKPVLQSGAIRCVGATTHDEFRRHLESDRALVRRLQTIEVGEPSVSDTVAILEGLKERYEEFHGVRYAADALSSAAELASRHIQERFLPDKAIDVMDEAGAANHLRPQGERLEVLTQTQVEEVVARIAKIPELTAKQDERARLAALEDGLKAVVFGQDEALDAVVAAIKLSRAGLGPPDQPVGSFLFTGPTGVGKTEVARQLAQVLAIGFVRFDMSEYMEKHAVSRLIGAPPGYVGFDQGGLLTSAIRKTPHCVLLLDEIEKAHQDLFDLLLQVMDHASLTDNNGRKADFRNVVLVMTSNAGARQMSQQGIGFGGRYDPGRGKKELERLFSPEFRNRLTEIVTFQALGTEVMERIVDKFVAALKIQLRAKGVTLRVTPAARSWLAREGHDEVFGARPLSRLIQRKVRQPLSEEVLFGALRDGGEAVLRVQKGELIVDAKG